MPIIANHHYEGRDPLPHDTDYRPVCAWPETAHVQWGSGASWVRYGAEDTGEPAFFEAFLADPRGIHFRGEGPTIADAERDAHGRYERFLACGDGHDWQRKFNEYSGVGCCARCGTTATKALPAKERPEPTDGPLTPRDLSRIAMGMMKPNRYPDLGAEHEVRLERWRAAVRLKAERQGFDFPDTTLDHEAHERASKELVAAFWHAHRAWYEEHAKTLPPPGRHEPAFMGALEVGSLDDLTRRWLRRMAEQAAADTGVDASGPAAPTGPR